MYKNEKNHKENEPKWYAMKSFRGNSLIAEQRLKNLNIESFVPKMYSIGYSKSGTPKEIVVPAIPNLFFARGTFKALDEACKTIGNTHFQYKRIHSSEKSVPIIVPDAEMRAFIDFIDGNFEHIEFLNDPNSFNLKAGEPVRIIAGPFKGKEGNFVKIKNKFKRQIVIEIKGLLGAYVKCNFPSRIIERIKE